MIDLDIALAPWCDARPWERALPDWGEASAYAAARAMARNRGLELLWEPGDEEWIRLVGDGACCALCSLYFPLFLAVPGLAPVIPAVVPEPVVVVPITDVGAENLRCSPDLLRATLLRHGWSRDFDPQAFCAIDLVVESVRRGVSWA